MIQYFSWNADGRLEVVNENGTIIFTNEDTYMLDKYGNTFTINDLRPHSNKIPLPMKNYTNIGLKQNRMIKEMILWIKILTRQV